MKLLQRPFLKSRMLLCLYAALFSLPILLSCSKVILVADQTEKQLETNKQGLKALTKNEFQELLNIIPRRAKAPARQPRHILIYNYTPAHWHDIAIVWGSTAIELIGKQTGAFTTTVSHDPAIFTNENLRKFDAIVLNNTQGNYFGDLGQIEMRKQALVDFVREGKGVIGIHGASVFENFDTPPKTSGERELRSLIGGSFHSHPWEAEPVSIRIEDVDHVLSKSLTKISGATSDLNTNLLTKTSSTFPLPYAEEIYQFIEPYSRKDLRVLISLDMLKTTDKGQRKDKDYALAWIKDYGKGKVFYSALGHNSNFFRNTNMLEFLLDGIQFAMGDLQADTTPIPQHKVDLDKDFVNIFNGTDLTGWRGDMDIWHVEDGCITAETKTATSLKENNFLIWEGGSPANFEIKVKYKLIGGNSGIYFHSFEREASQKNGERLVGPQGDFSADHAWTGVVMEYLRREKLVERGRKILITEKGEKRDAGTVGDPKELLKSVRDNDWNDYHLIVKDNLIIVRINDILMSEVRDNDVNRLKTGLLALQVHTGPAMKIQFKDVRIKIL